MKVSEYLMEGEAPALCSYIPSGALIIFQFLGQSEGFPAQTFTQAIPCSGSSQDPGLHFPG